MVCNSFGRIFGIFLNIVKMFAKAVYNFSPCFSYSDFFHSVPHNENSGQDTSKIQATKSLADKRYRA